MRIKWMHKKLLGYYCLVGSKGSLTLTKPVEQHRHDLLNIFLSQNAEFSSIKFIYIYIMCNIESIYVYICMYEYIDLFHFASIELHINVIIFVTSFMISHKV